MSKKRRGMTLEEHNALLGKEGRFECMLKEQNRREAEIDRKDQEDAQAEAPVIQELNAAGAAVGSVWDLVNRAEPYPGLIPILLKHLDLSYPERVREGIARALAVPQARVGWDTLVDNFLSETDSTSRGPKWALHLAIAAAADLSVVDTLIRLTADRRHGPNRMMFVRALVNLKDPRAVAALKELASDPHLADEIKATTEKAQRHCR